MNAVVQEAQPTTLFDAYATPEELDQVRKRHDAIAEAITERDRIRDALADTNHELTRIRRDIMGNARRKAQIAMGQPVDPLPPGPNEWDLQERATGLASLLNDAEELVKDRTGKFRGAVHDLIRACAERCGVDYYEATKRQAWAHQHIGIAQMLVGAYRPLVSGSLWMKYNVPGSDGLAAIKGKSQEEWGATTLMSASRLSVTQDKALAELRARCRELFGDSPL